MLRPRIPRAPVLSIVVALHISTAQLTELLADNFCVPVLVTNTAPAPIVPAHHRPELFTPERYFPTPAITEEIRALCTADFTLGELRHVLAARKRRSAPGTDGVTYQMLRNLHERQLQRLLEG
ncbi:hypothetical protein MTO96_037814, partial [Rhipicephalus appendiculatus]